MAYLQPLSFQCPSFAVGEKGERKENIESQLPGLDNRLQSARDEETAPRSIIRFLLN